MNGSLLVLITIVFLVVAYHFYGGWLARRFKLNNEQATPADKRADGVDFVKARMPVLLGHHFASIAGAAPIVGPVLAASFGWLPVWIWILAGGILMGAVHDFVSLVASIRHNGESIGRLIEAYMGRSGKLLFLLFSWLALLLVVAVFTLLVSGTFTAVPATASSSAGFLLLAVVFGLLMNRTGIGLVPLSILGVLLLFAILMGGQSMPLDLASWLPGGKAQAIVSWRWLILFYVFVASVTPVHLLLQPRDYLNSFLLYAMMFGGLAGIFISGPVLQIPAFSGFMSPDLGSLFPILFVTVACGAISGFHSLVASGTTARQLAREGDALPVAYGSMLIECLLAVVALVAVAASLNLGDLRGMTAGQAITRFAEGLAMLMSNLGLPAESGRTFVSLAVSAFALTSLDTATRLGRFAFEELAGTLLPGQAWLRNRYLATLLTVLGGAALLFSNAGKAIWPVFGAANQLLATLALLTATVWLSSKAKGKALFVLIPTLIMFAVTLSALGMLIWSNASQGRWPLALIASFLFLLALELARQGWNALQKPRITELDPAENPPDDSSGPACPC